MQLGEIYKYLPTSTVGKVQEIRERDGRVWALLDYTGLWYDITKLVPADPGEYKEIKFKYREASLDDNVKSIQDVAKEAKEVDITDMMPSGGG